MRQIFLSLATSDTARIASRIFRALPGTTVRWAYLGRDHGRAMQLAGRLGSRFERISYGTRFQALAGEWRDKYVSWIAAVSRNHRDDVVWWTSRIAEKNTMFDSLYHGICYLQIAVELMRDHDGPLPQISRNEK